MILKRFCKRFLLPAAVAVIGLGLIFALPYLPEAARDAADAVFTCALIPILAFAVVWAVWATLREFWIWRVRGEPLPPARECRLCKVLFAEAADFRAMEGGERAFYILSRLVFCAAAAFGILLLYREQIGPGTAVVVAGAFLCMLTIPNRYNRPTRTAKVFECPKQLKTEEIAASLASTDTVLGRPYVSRIRFVPGSCTVFGPGEDGIFLYIRKNRSGRRLFLIRSGGDSLIRNPQNGAPGKSYDGDLDTLTLYLSSLLEEIIRAKRKQSDPHKS